MIVMEMVMVVVGYGDEDSSGGDKEVTARGRRTGCCGTEKSVKIGLDRMHSTVQ